MHKKDATQGNTANGNTTENVRVENDSAKDNPVDGNPADAAAESPTQTSPHTQHVQHTYFGAWRITLAQRVKQTFSLGLGAELWQSDWSQLLWRTGLLGTPAVAICLLLGLYEGQSLPAAVAAGGAFTVGMGALQRFTRFSLAPMVLACIGVMACAWLGSMVGQSLLLLMVLSAALAALGGVASLIGPGATWIVQQCTIALVVAGAFPGPSEAVQRALLVGAGGALQLILMGIPILFFVSIRAPDTSKKAIDTTRPVAFATALRAASSLEIALGITRWIGFPNGYWAPMTAIIVLKPSLHDEFHSVLQRCAGTLLGSAFASFIVWLVRPDPLVLAVLTCLMAGSAYALNRVNYFVFSATLTAYIVFMLSTAHNPELPLLLHRVGATVLGCGVSLIIDLLLQHLGLDANRKSRAASNAA